jgi:hypothetical protein
MEYRKFIRSKVSSAISKARETISTIKTTTPDVHFDALIKMYPQIIETYSFSKGKEYGKAALSGVGCAAIYLNHVTNAYQNHFTILTSLGFSKLELSGLCDFVFLLLEEMTPHTKRNCLYKNEDVTINEYILGDGLSVAIPTEGKFRQGIYVTDSEKFNEVFRVLFKEKNAGKKFFVFQSMDKLSDGYRNPMTIVVDDEVSISHSQRAESFLTNLKKAKEKKINRSLMFYGPPGSGKSTLVRYCAFHLSDVVLRIKMEHLHEFSSDDMKFVFGLIGPDALIIDDIDRNITPRFLEMLEGFNRNIPFTFLTANSKTNIDHALIRPGRVDEIFKISRLDEDTIRNLIGDCTDEEFEKLKVLPIAYLHEFKKREIYLGRTAALSSVHDLIDRSSKAAGFYDKGDESESETVDTAPWMEED